MLSKLFDALQGQVGDEVAEELRNAKVDRVLLVDDDDSQNNLTRSAIEATDVVESVVMVKDGREAFRFLHKDVPATKTLILLDINMPVVDGWEFLKNYGTLPMEQRMEYSIVMLTSSVSSDQPLRAGELEHVDASLNKSVNHDALEDTIRTHFFADKTNI